MEVIIEQDKKTTRKIVAVGCCGLDFGASPENRETQLMAFFLHMQLAKKYCLPMYFRIGKSGISSSHADFVQLVRDNRHKFTDGIVH